MFILFLLSCQNGNQQANSLEHASENSLSNEALMDTVQSRTLRYFTHWAEPNSGMARERLHLDDITLDSSIVTTGGTGFGLMAILVGIERQFITREEGYQQIQRIVDFLENAPRFEGVWSHWLDGATGKVKAFGQKDDGGDIVETSFLVQGLLCVRQYFANGNPEEQKLSQQIDRLWKEVNWDFYRGPNKENVLFWHWSEEYEWEMNFRIRGYNETLITYILAASSPTYSVLEEVYHEGWAMNGQIVSSDQSNELPLIHQGNDPKGGPLFWAHYSFMGLNPTHLQDQYAHYMKHNIRHVELNRDHCIENPGDFEGYGSNCWGLTASYSMDFYAAHHPGNDLGVISPTAALSSMPYTPESSLNAMYHFYDDLGDLIWGECGFYDAFSETHSFYPKRYLAIDQGPIIVMIENYRSGLLWDLFMSCPEISAGLDKLGFTY